MDIEKIKVLWNSKVDQYNSWDTLDADEKVEFTINIMAAKNARLQAIIDEAKAQEPLCYFGGEYAVIDGKKYFDLTRSFKFKDSLPKGYLYAAPIPAQQLIEQAHMAGQADAGIDPSYSNAQAYAISIGSQQSPAVAVPYGFVNPKDRNSLNQYGYSQIESKQTDYSTVALYEHPSPRITEQDAYDIILNFYWYMEAFKNKHGKNPSVIEWREAEGRTLLEKLNNKG